MHRTTSTNISDTLIKLTELSEAINGDDFTWMAIEEKFATVVAGMHIMHELTKHCDPDHFETNEVEFINEMIGECNDIICELTEDMVDEHGDGGGEWDQI
jgi:hypothetical protein